MSLSGRLGVHVATCFSMMGHARLPRLAPYNIQVGSSIVGSNNSTIEIPQSSLRRWLSRPEGDWERRTWLAKRFGRFDQLGLCARVMGKPSAGKREDMQEDLHSMRWIELSGESTMPNLSAEKKQIVLSNTPNRQLGG